MEQGVTFVITHSDFWQKNFITSNNVKILFLKQIKILPFFIFVKPTLNKKNQMKHLLIFSIFLFFYGFAFSQQTDNVILRVGPVEATVKIGTHVFKTSPNTLKYLNLGVGDHIIEIWAPEYLNPSQSGLVNTIYLYRNGQKRFEWNANRGYFVDTNLSTSQETFYELMPVSKQGEELGRSATFIVD